MKWTITGTIIWKIQFNGRIVELTRSHQSSRKLLQQSFPFQRKMSPSKDEDELLHEILSSKSGFNRNWMLPEQLKWNLSKIRKVRKKNLLRCIFQLKLYKKSNEVKAEPQSGSTWSSDEIKNKSNTKNETRYNSVRRTQRGPIQWSNKYLGKNLISITTKAAEKNLNNKVLSGPVL